VFLPYKAVLPAVDLVLFPSDWFVALLLPLLLLLLLTISLLLLVSSRRGKSQQLPVPTDAVQSATCNFVDLGRKFNPGGPADRNFPAVDDVGVVGLGLVGS
jgi:hypothetical protein